MPKPVTSLVFLSLIVLSIPDHAAERPAPAVTAITAELKYLPLEYETTGTLMPDQYLELRSEISGKISAIHISPASRVTQGELLVEFDKRSKLNELKRLNIDLKLAEQQFFRLQKLARQRSTSRETLDVAQAEVARLNADIEALKLELEGYEIQAPFDGTLGNFDWQRDTWVTQSSLFTTIDNLNSLKLSFDLPERFLSSIKPGQSVKLATLAWPGELFSAQITLIEPRLDADRSTLSVEAVIENSEQKLRPGMRVKVSLADGDQQAKLVIPVRSLIHEQQTTKVFKLTADNTAKLQTIETGFSTEQWTEVISGLAPGDRVINRGIVKARSNRPVKVISSTEQDS